MKHYTQLTQEQRYLHIRGMDKPDNDLRCRARLNSLIRFTDFDWNIKGQHILQEIVIGPAAEESSAKSFAPDCLRHCKLELDKENIHKSKIPYRNT